MSLNLDFEPRDTVKHLDYGVGTVLMVGWAGKVPMVWVKFLKGDRTPHAFNLPCKELEKL